MKRLKLYLETSVWNFLFADDAPEKKSVTQDFFKRVASGEYETFVSETVLFEIGNAKPGKKETLLKAVSNASPGILYRDSEVDTLVESYISNGLLGMKQYHDILHLAFASANGIQILLSWNMRHMVNLKTKNIVNGTNRLNGYAELMICTPEEMIQNDA